ncbi:MAG: GC-type dockerin domain-anchored protein [Phycisphaerales bacterium]
MTRTRVGLMTALLLACGQAHGQQYLIQTLPPLPGYPDSFACGINEAGDIVGASRSSNIWRPTRWQNSAPIDLGGLPGYSQVLLIDIAGDGTIAVGEAWNAAGIVPFVWENSAITQISSPAGASAGCWQINDHGVIAGRGWTSTNNIACRWDKTPTGWVYSELPRLAGTLGGGAFGINNAGAIAGYCANGSFSTAQATVWTGGTPAALPGFMGASTIASINLSGLAVGDLELTPGGNWHAQRHDGTAYTHLGTLVYPNSYAHRVNAAGTIIGQSYADGVDPTGFPNNDKLAIIWRGATMTAVNDVIPAGSGWDVKQLWDINDSGRIVGYGRFGGLWRACLLVPTCYANCDASTTPPALNVNDFICFNNRFAAGDTNANCDGSTTPPTLNVNDFTCFLNQFAAGCS